MTCPICMSWTAAFFRRLRKRIQPTPSWRWRRAQRMILPTVCGSEKCDMETRRDTLKIIGAIGTTCAFPFASNDLYGQHRHATPVQVPSGPYTPRFFTAEEYAAVSRLADLIIPPTDTPGAIAAGAPEYIDYV